MTTSGRDLDVVVFGATGFTGALTSEYLAAHAPPGVRWAVAGRGPDRLRALRDRLGVDVPAIEADVGDPGSLCRLAEAARVVVTTVGPYVRYGEPLVAACAEAGTDYLDLTGEAEFVDLMYLRHHATAQRTGARLVHACGFDSVPYDLGAQFTVEQLPPGVPIRLRGYLSGKGAPSGGTFESAVTSLARHRQAGAVHRERRAVERRTVEHRTVEHRDTNRRVRGIPGRPGYERALGAWVFPLPTIDPQIVLRSARALDRYGPDFSYSHFGATGNPLLVAGLAAGWAGTFVLAQAPPTRRLLLRLRPSGAGPDPERRAKSWFSVRFLADSGDRHVTTEVAGGDPGYDETSKMLAEAALCLATDPLPETAGQLTTAVAMGPALRTRLEKAGISFRVLDQRPA